MQCLGNPMCNFGCTYHLCYFKQIALSSANKKIELLDYSSIYSSILIWKWDIPSVCTTGCSICMSHHIATDVLGMRESTVVKTLWSRIVQCLCFMHQEGRQDYLNHPLMKNFRKRFIQGILQLHPFNFKFFHV